MELKYRKPKSRGIVEYEKQRDLVTGKVDEDTLFAQIDEQIKRLERLIAVCRESGGVHCIASLQRSLIGLEHARGDLQRKAIVRVA